MAEKMDLSELTSANKLGLALSGGGFRASFFHIGVLARLAELDILKHVQVLSTVSGGSIVGAYYYLKLKELFEGRRKDLIAIHGGMNRDCYVALVREIEAEFLIGVRENLRVRAFEDAKANASIFLSDVYSRSDRMADLYDECFYRRFATHPDRNALMLDEIKIVPEIYGDGAFDVARHNETAEHKIPVLTINATSLNTGNSWHFTGSWVGEAAPRHAIGTNVVLNFIRLDGTYPAEAGKPDSVFAKALVGDREMKRQEKLKEIRVAHAVAASACVPGVFKPFPIHDLYRNSRDEEIVMQLVDGGVFDNQGIDALEMAACDYIICSDGSGQLEDERDPPSRALPVMSRANSVLMKRVREQTLGALEAGEAAGRRATVLHLRQTCRGDLLNPPLPGPADRSDPVKNDGLVYRLSNLRTDLDSFSDIEAFALMYHGYQLACERFLSRHPAPRANWRFLDIGPMILNEPARLLQHFKIGAGLWFKPFAFYPGARNMLLGVAALVFLGLFFLISDIPLAWLLVPAVIVGILYSLFMVAKNFFAHRPAVAAGLQWLSGYRRRDDTLLFDGLRQVFALVAGVTRLHLRYINPWFLGNGAIEKK